MDRTRHRPLPSGRLRPIDALIFGVVTALAGILFLWVKVNPLSAIVTGAIAALYLGAYTPMKRVTWLCHVIGAVPGALPPVIGWAAARNGLGGEPLILFAIMFLWQLPHSLSIARLYQRDYARAGIHMLPERGRYGDPANSVTIAAALALLLVGLLPALMKFAGLRLPGGRHCTWSGAAISLPALRAGRFHQCRRAASHEGFAGVPAGRAAGDGARQGLIRALGNCR